MSCPLRTMRKHYSKRLGVRRFQCAAAYHAASYVHTAALYNKEVDDHNLHPNVQPEAESTSPLLIFDTTLRDGEQSPGATLNYKEKMEIARALSVLGVDVCESGFPIASPGDFDAVRGIATEIGPLENNRKNGPMVIAGLARATEKDIQRCFDAVKYAPRHRIHTFLATSDIHLQYKLQMSRDDCLKRAVDAVGFAASLSPDVEFSPEDAGRSDPDFLVEVCNAVIAAGATTLNIPDTVGYTIPEEYGNLIKYLVDNVDHQGKGVVFSTHCHNDLGLASANTMAGIMAGARQAEVTINGIGERAGNTALEEVVMLLHTRKHLYPVHTQVDSKQIARCSRMVSHYTGMSIQPNKAIVGANAFAHESGIHQDGVLKHKATYEIMLPETVGLTENKMVLGKHSGRHAYKKRLEQLGYGDFTTEELDHFVEKFKVLADEKKTVTDADIEAIVSDEIFKPEAFWTLQALHVTAGNRVKPTATVTLQFRDGQEVSEAAMGTGPVDAVYQAIRRATHCCVLLNEFTIQSITDGTQALGEVIVRLQQDNSSAEEESDDLLNPQTGLIRNRQFVGHGANTDILVASATAYINALNRVLADAERKGTQEEDWSPSNAS